MDRRRDGRMVGRDPPPAAVTDEQRATALARIAYDHHARGQDTTAQLAHDLIHALLPVDCPICT